MVLIPTLVCIGVFIVIVNINNLLVSVRYRGKMETRGERVEKEKERGRERDERWREREGEG